MCRECVIIVRAKKNHDNGRGAAAEPRHREPGGCVKRRGRRGRMERMERMKRRERMERRGRVGNPPYRTSGTRRGGRRETIPRGIRERQGFVSLQSHVRELLSEYQRITSF